MAKGFKHGSGGDPKKVPILDDAYPMDVTVEAAGTMVTLEARIAEDGKPVGYAYQWYRNNAPVEGATGPTWTFPAELGSCSIYCIVTSKAGFVTSRTATVTAEKLYLLDLINGFTTKKENGNGWIAVENGVITATSTGSSNDQQGNVCYFGDPMIDLSQYKTLTFTADRSSYGLQLYVGFFSANTSYYSWYNNVAIAKVGSGKNTYTVDISNVDTMAYFGLGFAAGNTSGTLRVEVSDISLK